jgi:hypothetical protein
LAALSGRDLLALWEAGQGLSSVEQALVMAAAASPQRSWEELSALSVGRRDGLLLELRHALFGPSMPVYQECPLCRQQLEFVLDVRQFLSVAPAPEGEEERTLEAQGFRLRFRLPNSGDMAAAGACPDASSARAELLGRCVLQAQDARGTVDPADLPASVVAALEDRMEVDDPLAELRFDLACPQCGHAWWTVLDVGAYLWTEVTAQAQRLMQQVHLLARRYGWREADILSMSGRRRQTYLEMAV